MNTTKYQDKSEVNALEREEEKPLFLGKDRSASKTPLSMRKAKNRAKNKLARKSKQFNRKRGK